MKKQKTPARFGCSNCTFQSRTEGGLARHIQDFHNICCEICKSIHDSPGSYVAHVQKVHNSEKFAREICEKCGKQFLTRQSLKNHMESNCGTRKRFKCDVCNQNYSSRVTLAAHKLIHSGEKLYTCDYCGKQFISQGELKVHERKHTKEKPFKCNTCHKAFPYRESLVTHMSVHTGIKPYICENCGKTFSCVGNLQKHRRVRPFSCGLPEYCQQSKRIAPRTKTKRLRGGSDTTAADEGNKFKVEYLDENIDEVEPVDFLHILDEESSEVPMELDKSHESHSNIKIERLDLTEANIEESSMNDDDSHFSGDCDSQSDEQTHDPTTSDEHVDYDADFEQYAVQLLDEIDGDSTEMDVNMLKNGEDAPVALSPENVTKYLAEDTALNAWKAEPTTTPEDTDLETETYLADGIECDSMEEVYGCPSCCSDFKTTNLLIDHLQSEHKFTDEIIEQHFQTDGTELACPQCSKKFHLQYLYEKHLEIHENSPQIISIEITKEESEKPIIKTKSKDKILAGSDFICLKCGKKCFSRSAFREHEASNCGEMRRYKCDICNKFYYSLGSLKTHRTVHTGDLPFLCSYCGKSFRTKGEHAVHSRKHTGEKPFKCHICPKSFPYRQSLVTHITTHTGEKPFQCGCGQSFSCVRNLLSHRNTFNATCGQLPLQTKPVIQIGVIKGQLYVSEKSE